MKLRKLINLFTEQTARQPAQGVTGQKLAQTSGGQFTSRADRTNQAKVDAALGPGFKAGSAAANQALAKKFSQPQPATATPTATASAQQSAASDASKASAIGGQQSAPAAPYGGAAANAMAAKSAPTPAPQQTIPDQIPTQTATTAQSIGATNLQGENPAAPAPQAASPSGSGSSMTDPANVAQGQTGPSSSGYTNPAGMSGIDNTKPVQSTSGPAVTSGSKQPIGTGFGGTLSSTQFEEELEEEIEESVEKELEEAFNTMLRLSGIQLNEKAVSKQQQKFMGMVHAMQKGEKVKGASTELKKVARTMGKKDAKDFASTKHKGLPKKVTEGFEIMMDEEGRTLEHIVNRFKHETKTFLNTGEMSDNLYDALFDYYYSLGEMPYGVAKARDGDPYTWVAARFEADIDGTVDVKMPMGEIAGDPTLNELARLAGLTEVDSQPKEKSWSQSLKDVTDTYKTGLGMPPDRFAPVDSNKPFGPKKDQVKECDDMGMDTQDRLNVSTNMSSDGTKSVNISAQGEKADALLQMLKMAGMRPHDDHDHKAMSEPAVVMIGSDEEMMEADRETEYANTPKEEYETVASITRQGNDLNREKKQFANMPKAGDNPMATDYMLDEELSALLDSILVREQEPKIDYDEVSQRVKATFPPLKPRDPASQQIPMEPESPESRVTGPRELKIFGEPTGTENYGKDDEKEIYDEGSIKKGGPSDLTGTWSADPPEKGQPDVPPPVPKDPVYPNAKNVNRPEPQMKNMPLPKDAPEPRIKNMPLPKGTEPRTKPM